MTKAGRQARRRLRKPARPPVELVEDQLDAVQGAARGYESWMELISVSHATQEPAAGRKTFGDPVGNYNFKVEIES